MFNFLKKKAQPNIPQQIEIVDEDAIASIKNILAKKENELSGILNEKNTDTTHIAKLYEEMGLLVAKYDKDNAINYLESSLSYQLTIGEGYKLLMNLYNQKRAEAAKNGDGDGIDKWMDKMDEMRQIAKKVIITG